MVEGEVRLKTQKDWCEQSRNIHEQILGGVSERVEGAPPPWKARVPGQVLHTEIEKTQEQGEQLRKAEETLAGVEDVDIIIYTD